MKRAQVTIGIAPGFDIAAGLFQPQRFVAYRAAQNLEQHQLQLLDIEDARFWIGSFDHASQKYSQKRKIQMRSDADRLREAMLQVVLHRAAGYDDRNSRKRSEALLL